MGMCSLLLSLEAIECVCGQERSEKSNDSWMRKLCTAIRRVRSNLVPTTVLNKACTQKHCDLCKKHGGAYMTRNTCEGHRFEKDGLEKSDFRAAKKGGKKPNPTKQPFTQLSKKLDKLEKVIKKQDTKKRKRRSSDSDSDSE